MAKRQKDTLRGQRKEYPWGRNYTRYKFAKKEYAKKGIVSSILAGVTVIMFLISCFLSFCFRGAAGVFVGGIALMAMLLSVYGFCLGLSGFSEKSCSHVFCVSGAIANGVMMVIWLALFLVGV